MLVSIGGDLDFLGVLFVTSKLELLLYKLSFVIKKEVSLASSQWCTLGVPPERGGGK